MFKSMNETIKTQNLIGFYFIIVLFKLFLIIASKVGSTIFLNLKNFNPQFKDDFAQDLLLFFA